MRSDANLKSKSGVLLLHAGKCDARHQSHAQKILRQQPCIEFGDVKLRRMCTEIVDAIPQLRQTYSP